MLNQMMEEHLSTIWAQILKDKLKTNNVREMFCHYCLIRYTETIVAS